jgi:hypothetical protein
MPPSKISVVNQALTHLGARTIGSLAENSEAARRAALLWDDTVDEVLRAYPWKFASLILPLTVLAETTPEWTYLYAMPPDCLRVWRVFNQIVAGSSIAAIPVWDNEGVEDWKKQQEQEFERMLAPTSRLQAIASDLPSAYAHFTARVADPSVWDASCVKAMGYKLAAELCRHLVGNPDDLQPKMENKYLAAISEAGRQNASEGRDRAQKTSSPLLDSRI